MTPMNLTIRLCEGTDMTGAKPLQFPEIRIAGDEAGLRHLRRQISRVLRASRGHSDAHTHLTHHDGPGIAMTPESLMLTIERLGDDD